MYFEICENLGHLFAENLKVNKVNGCFSSENEPNIKTGYMSVVINQICMRNTIKNEVENVIKKPLFLNTCNIFDLLTSRTEKIVLQPPAFKP